MYYSDVVKEIMERDKSLIKNINWDNQNEVKKIKEVADKVNIKKDCKTITKAMDGAKNDIIDEQQRIIETLCDAVAFFCSLAFMLDKKLSLIK